MREVSEPVVALPTGPARVRIPRGLDNDYTDEMAAERRRFVLDRTGAGLSHVGRYSLDPATLPGNIEHFIGAAQVPVGLAGPLRILGEHAEGDFYIPLATTEGTLVASYNRGMRLLTESGGVKTTVVEDSMQRAPVFVLDDGHDARQFGEWVDKHFQEIKQSAESTSRFAKLHTIRQYSIGPLRTDL